MNNSSSTSEKKKIDWSIVLEFIVKVLTIGLGHVKKREEKSQTAHD